MGRSKKKRVSGKEDYVGRIGKSRTYQSPTKKRKPAVRKGKDNEASARFTMITERARKIRQKHPKMKWKNCIKQASKELYG